MNTKTMRLPPRRVLTPNSSASSSSATNSGTHINVTNINISNKRKEREDGFDGLKPSTPGPPPPTTTKLARTEANIRGLLEPAPSSNQLLAGYLAHEFLTKGTLFGQVWDPSRAEIKRKDDQEEHHQSKPRVKTGKEVDPKPSNKCERYVELASLLKTGGVHLPGIVNPTLLARFLD